MTKEPVPVVPAAHYMCGGVVSDNMGRTTIENLYALGETACTGLHGANRLASNSLLEAVVFAHQAFLQCQKDWQNLAHQKMVEVSTWRAGVAENLKQGVLISHNWDQIRRLMWNYVGIVRSEQRLLLVQKRLAPILKEISQHFHDYLLTPDLVELRNLALIAELIVSSALHRKESRGLHCMAEYPQTDDAHWQHDTELFRQDDAIRIADNG
jgi:L-aspartate oxidase